jgi:hypothetical protein
MSFGLRVVSAALPMVLLWRILTSFMLILPPVLLLSRLLSERFNSRLDGILPDTLSSGDSGVDSASWAPLLLLSPMLPPLPSVVCTGMMTATNEISRPTKLTGAGAGAGAGAGTGGGVGESEAVATALLLLLLLLFVAVEVDAFRATTGLVEGLGVAMTTTAAASM